MTPTQNDLFPRQFVPSDYQQALFDEIKNGTGHIVVEAVAGSGKTTTIIESLRYVPRDKRVLLCAFNVEIRKTLQKRVVRDMDVETFHALGYRCLRSSWGPDVTISADRDLWVLSQAAEKMGVSLSRVHRWTLKSLVSLCKAHLAWADADIERVCAHHLLDVDEAYFPLVREAMHLSAQKTNVISFDDMIFAPIYSKLLAPTYDVIFVDETQDLNQSQWIMVRGLLAPGGRIIAVGDSRQAIYGFRGARSNGMDQAVQDLNATRLPLSVSYRCPRLVIDFVKPYHETIQPAPNAPDGIVRTATIDEIWQQAQKKDLVLSRTNAALFSLCLAGVQRRVRVKMVGRNLGQELIELIEKSKSGTIDEFMEWLDRYRQRMQDRLEEQEEALASVIDRIMSVRLLCLEVDTIEELRSLIDFLCVTKDTDDSIRFSSVHRAKGLEADRVWVLNNTFQVDHPKPKRRQEERNLYYVALTRAKRELILLLV